MKRLCCFLLLALIGIPAWGAKKITVGELTEMLKSMQRDKKSDADVANALKQVQLSEELTRGVMNALVEYVPGQLSTEQIYVLEARSALLAPPSGDIPATATPDEAGQKAILDKATTYVTSTYAQLPALQATRTSLRFQDNVEAVAPSSGLQGSATDVSVGSSFVSAFQFVHYINSSETTVASEHGVEKSPTEKDKTPWGANKMIALKSPDPNLASVFSEAQSAGGLKWLRWETVNGKAAGVYTFSVPRSKTKTELRVCCFPNISQAGSASFYNSTLAGGGSGGVKGSFQTNTDWHEFKTTVGYHGEFFIDPDTGTVVRLITQAELKPSDVVHQLDTRIDYAPATLGGKSMVLPIKTVINTEVVPNGDSGAGRYSTRCTLFTAEYKNYQLAGAAAQK